MIPFFTDWIPRLEDRIDSLLTDREVPCLLREAMRYSVLGGGKRLRGTMLTGVATALGADEDTSLDFAAAVEMIHAYSLIHDDLPGMDNDVLRRGKPTNHVVYGEGQAILAGDGLLNTAFEVMLARVCRKDVPDKNEVRAMSEIMKGAGTRGMIAGQCLDLDYEKRTDVTQEMLARVHYGKTCCMFIYPLRAAVWLAGREDLLKCATSFGENFGRLFQTTDDILDACGDEKKLGKTTGKDEASGKTTYCSLMGLKGAEQKCLEWAREAGVAADGLAPAGDALRSLTDSMIGRDH